MITIKTALKEYQLALTINPGFYKANYNLGNLYMQMGKLDEGIRAFKMALKLNPQFIGARKNLATKL